MIQPRPRKKVEEFHLKLDEEVEPLLDYPESSSKAFLR